MSLIYLGSGSYIGLSLNNIFIKEILRKSKIITELEINKLTYCDITLNTFFGQLLGVSNLMNAKVLKH